MSLPSPSALLAYNFRKPRYIVTDFDGTLVHKHTVIPEESLLSLWKARESGYDFVIATGRTRFGVQNVLEANHASHLLSASAGIFMNGSLVYGFDDPHKPIAEKRLDPELVEELILFTQEHKWDAHASKCVEPQTENLSALSTSILEHASQPRKHSNISIGLGLYSYDTCTFPTRSQLSERVAEYADAHYQVCEDILHYAKHHPIHKVLILFCDESSFYRYKPVLSEVLKNRASLSTAVFDMLEINPLGVNKATALEYWLRAQNLTLDHVVAIGDGENDIEMLRKVPLSFCMGGSPDRVAKSARFQTSLVQQKGWSQVIDLVVETYKLESFDEPKRIAHQAEKENQVCA